MKQCLFLIVLLCFSCNYFVKEKVNSQDILEEELQAFNWNDVDVYPTFDGCDSITNKQEKKMCFETILVNEVHTFLNQQNLITSEDVNDTITLKFQIDKKGRLKVNSIKVRPETKEQIPEIDSLLRQSVVGIPKIYPAIKRGQQVTTVFEMPIIVKIN